ncbi:hypothetical protein UJ101_01216 [Flavobacteriaceae bacterium UJ101]|nr:hypothetical protein UJ101_01216 [Flavobacteriaceae bacterium UJ101]
MYLSTNGKYDFKKNNKQINVGFMKKRMTSLLFVASLGMYAQVGINTDNPKSTLDITAKNTDGSTAEGIMVPRLTGAALETMKDNLDASHNSMIAYATEAGTSDVTTVGYYYYDHASTTWKPFDTNTSEWQYQPTAEDWNGLQQDYTYAIRPTGSSIKVYKDATYAINSIDAATENVTTPVRGRYYNRQIPSGSELNYGNYDGARNLLIDNGSGTRGTMRGLNNDFFLAGSSTVSVAKANENVLHVNGTSKATYGYGGNNELYLRSSADNSSGNFYGGRNYVNAFDVSSFIRLVGAQNYAINSSTNAASANGFVTGTLNNSYHYGGKLKYLRGIENYTRVTNSATDVPTYVRGDENVTQIISGNTNLADKEINHLYGSYDLSTVDSDVKVNTLIGTNNSLYLNKGTSSSVKGNRNAVYIRTDKTDRIPEVRGSENAVYYNSAAPSTSIRGNFNIAQIEDGATGEITAVYGNENRAYDLSTNGRTLDVLYGGYSHARVQGDANINNQIAIVATTFIEENASGTIKKQRGLSVSTGKNGNSTATLENEYGITIGSVEDASDINWALYSEKGDVIHNDRMALNGGSNFVYNDYKPEYSLQIGSSTLRGSIGLGGGTGYGYVGATRSGASVVIGRSVYAKNDESSTNTDNNKVYAAARKITGDTNVTGGLAGVIVGGVSDTGKYSDIRFFSTEATVAGDTQVNTDAYTKMIIEGDTGNVGIGTASPAQKLTVEGNIQVKGTGATITEGGSCPNVGTITFSGDNFYGCKSTGWIKLHN